MSDNLPSDQYDLELFHQDIQGDHHGVPDHGFLGENVGILKPDPSVIFQPIGGNKRLLNQIPRLSDSFQQSGDNELPAHLHLPGFMSPEKNPAFQPRRDIFTP
jgi:hypothetical protein